MMCGSSDVRGCAFCVAAVVKPYGIFFASILCGRCVIAQSCLAASFRAQSSRHYYPSTRADLDTVNIDGHVWLSCELFGCETKHCPMYLV
jgi:hypothetical protein